MIEEGKFKNIKAKKLRKDSQIKIDGATFLVEKVKKVKEENVKLVMKQDKQGRRYEYKVRKKETLIVATVYKYCYENAFEDLVFKPNEIINVRKFTKRELAPRIDYAPPKGHVPDYNPSELLPSDDKSEKCKDEFFMFGGVDTREIAKRPTKTAKEVEEVLAKKVAEATKGDEEKIAKIIEETISKKGI